MLTGIANLLVNILDMLSQMSSLCISFVAKVTLKFFWLVWVWFGPLFPAPHQSLLGGIPLNVVPEAHRVAEICLAGGAVEESQSLVFG